MTGGFWKTRDKKTICLTGSERLADRISDGDVQQADRWEDVICIKGFAKIS